MEESPTSAHLVRLLASEDRRRVVAALILSDAPLAAADLAEASGVPVRGVVDAADRLLSGGLLIERSGTFELVVDAFQQAARNEAPRQKSEHADQPTEIARVLDAAFRDGRLVQWPAKRSKRLLVLDHLAQQFDIGRRYQESEVNERLREFNDDVATMRRYLVDEQFLDRSSGEYWRCGGSF